jgi:O-antigen/teichoic acid export membrane protein
LVLAVACGALLALLSYFCWFYLTCLRSGTFLSRELKPFRSLIAMLRLWRAWLPFTVSFFAFFLYFGSDRILVEALLGAESLAVYTAAYSFIALGQIVVTAFWSLYMPRISRGDQVFSLRKFVTLAMALSLGMVAGYQVFARYLFDHFYPDGYAEGALILSVMSAFFIFVRMRVGCGLVSVVLNVLCIPVYGLIAPALVVILCEALLCLFILGSEWRWRRTPPAIDAPGLIDKVL